MYCLTSRLPFKILCHWDTVLPIDRRWSTKHSSFTHHSLLSCTWTWNLNYCKIFAFSTCLFFFFSFQAKINNNDNFITYNWNIQYLLDTSTWTEWSITRSTGQSGLILSGSPPSLLTASRMAAKSTTAGTPLKKKKKITVPLQSNNAKLLLSRFCN